MTKITICGGGSLGHVCLGVLSSQSGVEVNLLTTRPESWSHQIKVTDQEGNFPCGLRFIYELCRQQQLVTPHIDEVYAWGLSEIKK